MGNIILGRSTGTQFSRVHRGRLDRGGKRSGRQEGGMASTQGLGEGVRGPLSAPSRSCGSGLARGRGSGSAGRSGVRWSERLHLGPARVSG